MSEKSKGDTSASTQPSRIVKNPLLSASVTGLTYEDFPLLLPPAALPMVQTRETKSLVTVGPSADADTEETLDEINLNAITEEAPPAQIDVNSNPLLEGNNVNNESILSQAASSFSVLPSVASSVLSTFSKRIYSSNSSRERSPITATQDPNDNPISQLDIQPQFLQVQQTHQPHFEQTLESVPPPFYAPPPPQISNDYLQGSTAAGASVPAVPVEPPKFYTPAEVPTLPTSGSAALNANPNTYRLAAKKKLYAPIPGFSDQHQQPTGPTIDSSGIAAPITQPQSYIFNQAQPQTKVEDRKGGLFSLTSLVPTGVLQNISGLVQSAAGTLTQSAKPSDSPASNHQYTNFPYQTGGSDNVNYLGSIETQQTSGVLPPPPIFYPTSDAANQQPQSSYYFASPQQSPESLPPPPQSFGNTTAHFNTVSVGGHQAPLAAEAPLPLPPLAPPIQTSGTFLNPPTFEPINLLDPSKVTGIGTTNLPANPSTTSTFSTFPPEPANPTAPISFNPFDTPPTAPPTIELFGISPQQTVEVPTTFAAPPPQTLPQALPSAAGNLPPPVTGQTSFRLQKGTRLYKSPETAADSRQPQPAGQQSQGVFNPFALPRTTNTPVGNYFVPNIPVAKSPSLFNPLPTQSAESATSGPIQAESSVPPPTAIFNPLASQPSVISGPINPIQSQADQLPPPTAFFNPLATKPVESIAGAPISSIQSQADRLPPPTAFFNPLVTKTIESEAGGPISSIQSQAGRSVPPPTAFFNPLATKPVERVAAGLDRPEELPAEFSETTPAAIPQFAASAPEVFLGDALADVNLKSTPNLLTPPQTQQKEQLLIAPTFPQCFQEQIIEPVIPGETDEVKTDSIASAQLEAPENVDIKITTAEIVPPATVAYSSAALPPLSEALGQANPYRKGSLGSSSHKVAPSAAGPLSLANFFTPAPSHTATGDTNFDFFNTRPVNFETVDSGRPSSNTFFNVPTEPVRPDLSTVVPGAPSANTFFNVPAEPVQVNSTSVTSFFSASQPPNLKANQEASSGPPSIKPADIYPPLTSLCGIAQPPAKELASGVPITDQTSEQSIAPPLGFDNIVSQIQHPVDNLDTKTSQQEAIQATTVSESFLGDSPFSNYFSQTPTAFSLPQTPLHKPQEQQQQQLQPQLEPQLQPQLQSQLQPQLQPQFQPQLQRQLQQEQHKLLDVSSFFDNFAPQAIASASTDASISKLEGARIPPAAQANEDQRIQNFFNNPPPKEDGNSGIGDLNYDLVHSGLGVKNLQTRCLTPASNLVEPPSSSCSEFSELNISSATQNPSKANSERGDTAPSKAANADEAAGKQFQEFSAPSSCGSEFSELNISIATQNTSKANSEKSETTPSHQIQDPADDPCSILAKHYQELPEEVLHELRMANLLTGDKAGASAPTTSITYAPAVKHWFFKRPTGDKHIWIPFSHYDSALLETSLNIPDDTPNIVAVEGGRYDVNIRERTKAPVYWKGGVIEVRRCSWFYKGIDSKYVPYDEQTAEHLEAEYKQASESGEWRKTIVLSMGEQVVFHGPTVMVQFQQQQGSDAWGGTSQSTTRPRVVKRDLDDFKIEQGESQHVNHLVLMVHGIGSACDLKLRTIEEVVDDFRAISQQLVQAHYKNSAEMGLVGRIEVLPISWHSYLHSAEMGIDEKLKKITLESIPRLRNFTNDTLLDVLFYTSPTYCQKIVNTVAASMNSVYQKYHARNPNFSGGVSLAGHSLGSLILFDLLCHQQPIKESEEKNMENPDQQFLPPQISGSSLDSNQAAGSEITSKKISYTMGPAGTGQPFIQYAQLTFQPKKFFAFGSPIGMFVTIRGIDKLGLDFRLPTCPGFYNIFHPFDPVAYRIEALVNPDMCGIRAVLIPHHKGRKRMHLELKETMAKVSADLKSRFFETLKTTLGSVNFLGGSKSKKEAEETMEKEVDKVLEMQMQLDQQQQQQQQGQVSEQTSGHSMKTVRSRTSSTSTVHSDDMVELEFPLGKLNDSKRIDYVLQEAPLEFFNEYLFALSSHVCYWESEDTILFVIKEIYSGLGVSPDSQVPQQTMSIERPNSRNGVSTSLLPPET